MFILSVIGFVLAISAKWGYDYFGLSCFEQIIFHLKVPLEGTNPQVFKDWGKQCFFKGLVIGAVLCVPCFFPVLGNCYGNCYGMIAGLVFAGTILYALWKVRIVEYVINQFRTTDLYEKYYVDGNKVNITFPQKKRNLILLYVESMETTYTSKENGGDYTTDLIPEISALAKENLNFSHQEKLGGAHIVAGTGWTTGGLVGQSAGVPLCVPVNGPNYKEGTEFLPGAYCLGDILKKEGYEQEFLIGSDAPFGGRKFYYDTHGNYKIFDIKEAKKQGKMPEDYRVFWGYEDEKLFKFAKEEVTALSKCGKPFNFTMLTVDTHHPYGYVDQNYQQDYPEQLSNIIRGSSKKVGAFVEWLKEQPFYEDTTILITGDHISMAAEYINSTYNKNYDRTIFNTFIHSAVQTANNKNRLFTSFDMYPTILSAIGAKVEGDKLGLGVNLFSGRKTIAEEIGLTKLDQELRKQSKYFKEQIVGCYDEKGRKQKVI